MNILIVDDDVDSAHVLESTLVKGGNTVRLVSDGTEALDCLSKQAYDAILTDWMLPKMDGIDLIRQVRKAYAPAPLIIMLTAITLPKARAHALKAGADDYLAKPCVPQEVLRRLEEARARRAQPAPKLPQIVPGQGETLPSHVAICISTSTGGPVALSFVLRSLTSQYDGKAAVFVVLHGPDWMLDAMPNYLQEVTSFVVKLGEDKAKIKPGHLYLAPANRHMQVSKDGAELVVADGPKENYVRPSADPLLRSVATVYGRYSISVVLTGMGRDATNGSAYISAEGGVVLVQDPKSAVAPSMPQTVIQSGLAGKVAALEQIGETMLKSADNLFTDLTLARQKKTRRG